MEELAKDAAGLLRQVSFLQRAIHQLHPAVACGLIDEEGCVTNAEARMSPPFQIAGWAAEAEDQELTQAVFSPGHIILRVHWTQDVVLWNLAVEGSNQGVEALFAYGGVNVFLFHY